MSSSSDLHTGDLGLWLAERFGSNASVSVSDLQSPKAGFSNETIFFRALSKDDHGESDRRYVLRRAGTGTAIYPVQTREMPSSVAMQSRVLRGLASARFRLSPRVIAEEPTDQPLGRPFFIMDFVEGRVLPDFPSYVAEGFFRDEATPSVRKSHTETGLAAMAGVHRLDWRAAGLKWLDRSTPDASPMDCQLTLWRDYVESVPDCRENPLLERSLSWLERERPSGPEPALSWGDARIQNMIFDDDGVCRSIVDWEGAAILPPEVDLAWWLGVDHFIHEGSGVERLSGELSQDEQIAWYEGQLGRPTRDLPYYRVFAAFRTVALMISTFDRLAAMGVADGGSTSDNPYEPMLAEALERASGVG